MKHIKDITGRKKGEGYATCIIENKTVASLILKEKVGKKNENDMFD